MVPRRGIALARLDRHRLRDDRPRSGCPQALEFLPGDTERSRRIHEAAGKDHAGDRCGTVDHGVTNSAL